MGQSVTRTPSTVPVTMIKAQLAAAPAKVAVVASKAADAAKFAGVAAASLAVAFQASAVTIKMGADNGGLVFEPSSVSVKAGETITFVNNAGFPHNVVFDEDAVPAGVNADKISHEDYFNAPGRRTSSSSTRPARTATTASPTRALA